jgi:hypothetical protein
MVATLPHNRIGRDSPAPVRRELPTSHSGRKELWGDTVLEVVMALREQLNSRNEQIRRFEGGERGDPFLSSTWLTRCASIGNLAADACASG